VITASNGKEGLEKAIKYLPNMIVSDVVMPEMTGIEMVKKLQANTYTCHIPIVLLSSKADVENQNEGLELGVDDYITKPFSASYLNSQDMEYHQTKKADSGTVLFRTHTK